MRLLLAEDDPQLRALATRALREWTFSVDPVSEGDAALFAALTTEYDALILDALLPRRSGLEVCRELRDREKPVPILLLTEVDAVAERIAGMDAGADDYLSKPFAFDELLARVRSLLRRRPRHSTDPIVVEDLVVDPYRQRVMRAGRAIELSAKEYALVEYLARNVGKTVSRQELVMHVWNNHEPPLNRINICINRVRKKIDAGDPRPLLAFERGTGFRLGDLRPARGSDSEPR